MKIWVCIPVFNRIEYTLKCLASIYRQSTSDYKVVICDHGSTDGTAIHIEKHFPEVIVLKEGSELWWTGAINKCIEYALQKAEADDCIFTLNNDTELPIDYLEHLMFYTKKYSKAIITSVIKDIKTNNVVSVGYRQSWWLAKSKSVSFEKDHIPDDLNLVAVTHASGRGTLFPVAAFLELGHFDETHLPHYGADYDFSHRARRSGFPIYVCRECIVLSHIKETGLTKIRKNFSLSSFVDYLTGMRSPANIKVRWWYGWNNCPKILLPLYLVIDYTRIIGSYFKYFAEKK